MPTIHSSAVISGDAQLAADVTVGPFSIIEGPAVIGPGCEIGAHVGIYGDVRMGSGNRIGHGAVLGGDPQHSDFDPATPSSLRLGEGNILREHVTIHRSFTAGGTTVVGDGNYLMVASHLGHDVVMGDGNTIANNVMLAGHVEVGDKTFLGGGAGFHQFLRIGDYAFVQGNCAISKDVPPYCFAFGANRLGGLNVIGLRRAGIGPEERKDIKAAYTILFRSDLNLSEALAQAAAHDWSPAARLLIEAASNPTRRGILTREG